MKARYPSWDYEYRKKYQKAYREKNGEALKQAHARWYKENKSKRQIKSREYYLKNKELIKAKVKAWKSENLDRANATRRRRYQEAHEHYIQKSRQYSHKRTVTGKAAEYRQRTRNRWREWSRQRSEQCGDDYAREQLSKYSLISAKEWPMDLVEAKKLEIKIKREIRNEKRHRVA